MKPSTNHRGYQLINFTISGKSKTFAVHILVAKQFIPNNDPTKTQVNHKDGNKQKNTVDNLEWVTPKENMEHAINVLGFIPSETLKKPVIGINVNNTEEILYFDSVRSAIRFLEAKDFSRASAGIYRVLKSQRLTCGGYFWLYGDETTNIDIETLKNRKSYSKNRAKLTPEDINWIREKYIPNSKEYGSRALSRKFNIDKSSILLIVQNKTYKNI